MRLYKSRLNYDAATSLKKHSRLVTPESVRLWCESNVDNDIDLQVTKGRVFTLQNVGPTNATGVVLSEVLTILTGVTVDSVGAGTSVVPIDATHYTWNVGSSELEQSDGFLASASAEY